MKSFKQESKRVLITGATSGIGEATVRMFAHQGWSVIGTTRREGEFFPELENVQMVELEQSDSRSIEACIQNSVALLGGLDLLVNNAGYCLMGPLEANTMEQVRAQYETNVFGPMMLIQQALPELKRSQGGVINVSSISADNGYPFNSVYSSSKAAVMALTEGLNVEWESIGVFCKAILPGFIATEIFTKLVAPGQMPQAYTALWKHFVSMQAQVRGFPPELVASSIMEAATDGKADKVRYYPTKDAASIPSAKRLLGHARYWRVFRRTILNGPSALGRLLTPDGGQDVKVLLPHIESRP